MRQLRKFQRAESMVFARGKIGSLRGERRPKRFNFTCSRTLSNNLIWRTYHRSSITDHFHPDSIGIYANAFMRGFRARAEGFHGYKLYLLDKFVPALLSNVARRYIPAFFVKETPALPVIFFDILSIPRYR